MAVLKRTRSAQYPLVQEMAFNYNDGMAYLTSLTAASVDTVVNSPVTDFGSKVSPVGLLGSTPYVASTNAASNFFELLNLPYGAQVVSGELLIENPYVGPTAVTLAIGDTNSGTLYVPATSLVATAFTNQPSGITNATAGSPQTVTLANATANGVTAVGQVITISGCTGASAAYNGSYLVDSFTATSVVVTNANLTSSLTLAGTAAATFITSRVPFTVPGQISSQGGYGATVSAGSDAAAGADVRGTLAFTGGQAATSGRIRVRVTYVVQGRANEPA